MIDGSDDSGRQDRREALRTAYGAALPRRIAEIQSRWDAIQRGHGDAPKWREFCRLIHTIAGSAGTFGFRALAQKARELEEILMARDSRIAAEPDADIGNRLVMLGTLAEKPDSPSRPVAVAPTVVAQSTVTAGDAAKEAEPNRLLFVIEDEPLLAQEIAEQLSRFGWDAQVYHTASEAEVALRNTNPPPVAVVVDVGLPEGSLAGTRLMQRVHDPAHAPIPHVVISVRWDWESRLEASRAGAAAYLVKPIDFGVLAEKLDAATRSRALRPYRVLIVEDPAVSSGHYGEVLGGAGMDVMTVIDPSTLLETLAEFGPDLILMDLYLPGCGGVEVARVIRQDSKFASVPIVFLSTESVRQLQLAAMRTGADDFLQTPIRDAELIAAVSIRAERFREIAALIRQDSLTGLLNHISFKLQLEAEIERSRRARSTLSLAMIDIDQFKRVNDAYGHPVGDRVIRAVAELLRRRLRKSDLLGRYGGEEFVVLMPDTGLRSAAEVVDVLRGHFASIRYVGGPDTFACTFSAGVAAAPPATAMDDLIQAADAALYEAKRAGRNCVRRCD